MTRSRTRPTRMKKEMVIDHGLKSDPPARRSGSMKDSAEIRKGQNVVHELRYFATAEEEPEENVTSNIEVDINTWEKREASDPWQETPKDPWSRFAPASWEDKAGRSKADSSAASASSFEEFGKHNRSCIEEKTESMTDRFKRVLPVAQSPLPEAQPKYSADFSE